MQKKPSFRVGLALKIIARFDLHPHRLNIHLINIVNEV
jgi:hypothetical protein